MDHRLRRVARLVAIPALLALGAATAPVTSAGNPCFHGYEVPPASSGPGTDVKLMPCAFEPTVTIVDPGTTVNFHNGPEYTHMITGANLEWGSGEIEVQPNTVVSYTFEEEGIYPYACVLHPGMVGAIVVGDIASGLGAGSGPVTGGPPTVKAVEPTPAPVLEKTAEVQAAEAAAAQSVAGGSASNASAPAAAQGGPIGQLLIVGSLIAVGGVGIAAWLGIRRRPATREATTNTDGVLLQAK